MLTRFPDSPIMSNPAALSQLRDGEWCCQLKMNGWRCVLELADHGPTFTSRHNRPLPIAKPIEYAIAELLYDCAPAGSIFDCEWMSSRREDQPESLIIFDVLRHGLDWVTTAPLLDRFLLLHDLVPHQLIVGHTWTHYAEFFEASKALPAVEGIVLKRRGSRYIGSARGCADNSSWLKVRHKLPVSLKVA
jgi:ATP-dependent DNA ligase